MALKSDRSLLKNCEIRPLCGLDASDIIVKREGYPQYKNLSETKNRTNRRRRAGTRCLHGRTAAALGTGIRGQLDPARGRAGSLCP